MLTRRHTLIVGCVTLIVLLLGAATLESVTQALGAAILVGMWHVLFIWQRCY